MMKTLDNVNHADKATNAAANLSSFKADATGEKATLSLRNKRLYRRSVSGYMCMDGALRQSQHYVNAAFNGLKPEAKKNIANAGLHGLRSSLQPAQAEITGSSSRKRQRDSSGEFEVFAYIPKPKVKRTVNSGDEAAARIRHTGEDISAYGGDSKGGAGKMSAKQNSNRNFAQKIKDTFLFTKSEPKSSAPKTRPRSKTWSKADRGGEKVKCRDRKVTLTTDNCNYAKWNGELREANKENGMKDGKPGLFTCTGVTGASPEKVLPTVTKENTDFYVKSSLIYYPSDKKEPGSETSSNKTEDYNQTQQGNKSPSGFSIRKFLHLKPKHHGKDDHGGDDSNNNYCLMEKLQSMRWEEINNGNDSAPKAVGRYHDYCTDLDAKFDSGIGSECSTSDSSSGFSFKRSEAIYGTGKRRSRRNYSTPGPGYSSHGRGPDPPPLPRRPSSIAQEPGRGEGAAKQPVGVARRPSVPCDVVSQVPYGGIPGTNSRVRTPVKEKEVELVKTLKLSFLQKSVISGVAVTRKQEYVVVDLKEAYIVDDDGHLKRSVGNKGSQRLQEPIAVTTLDGNLVFSDHAHQEVKIYTPRGQFLKKVADKSLCNIAGVAVNDKRQIFICGTDKQRVSVHSEEDDMLFTIPNTQTKDKPGGGTYAGSSLHGPKSLFDHPYSIAINPLTGDIIVGDDYEQKVTAVSTEGRVLWRFVPPCKFTERAFFPCSIAVDPLGYVFVADLLNANVYMLDSSGRFLKTLLSRADGLTTGPAAIATDGKGQLIVADDDRTLKVFRYGNGDSAIPRRISVVPQF